jgi:hypothetical protein
MGCGGTSENVFAENKIICSISWIANRLSQK